MSSNLQEKKESHFQRARTFSFSAIERAGASPKIALFTAVILCFLISLVEKYIQQYWLYVSYDIGINIILAVSLNLSFSTAWSINLRWVSLSL